MDVNETKAFFDTLAPEWDETNEVRPEILNAVPALLQGAAQAKILDIACGTGILEPVLLSMEPRQLWAIDLSPKMLARAKEKCRDPRVTFWCGDLFAFMEAGFDCAVLYNAYPHFPDKAALFQKIADCLKPGGRFLLLHGDGRDVINACHGGSAKPHSQVLGPAFSEAERLSPWFEVDVICDAARLYCISGRKK